jgi:uncharacterized protein (TIGR02246 family)
LLTVTAANAHDSKAHAAAPIVKTSEAAKPAVAVVDQFSSALKAADFETVSKLLAEDVLILESGGAERSREEYLGHHALADAMFLKSAHVQVKQRTARVDGSLAWVGTESELHAMPEGKALTLLSTETMILKKTSAGWRIVHIHWSSRPKKEDMPAKAS